MTSSELDAGLVEEPDVALPSVGRPGLTWRGDGALGGATRRSAALGGAPDEVYPPALDEGGLYELATFNRRWIGYVIDRVALWALLTPIWFVVWSSTDDQTVVSAQLALALTLLELGYGVIFNPIGWSPGKRAMGLRIVRSDGEPPGMRYGIVRTAGAQISAALFLLGYLWAYWDQKHQTWHDKFAGTYVVRSDRQVDGGAHVGWQRRPRP